MKRLLFLCVILSLVIDALGGQVVTPGDSIHVNHYDIHITNIDFDSKEIIAETTVNLISLVDFLTVIPLELQNLTVDSVYLEGIKVENFTHEGSDLLIPVLTTGVSGTEYTTTVWYHGSPFHESWGGFHWYGEYAFNLGVGFVSQPHNLGKAWYPCVDNFTDRSLYDIKATVSEGLSAISGGVLVDKQDNDNGTATWHWQIQHPLPTYLASIAIGPYHLYSDTYQGMERDIPIEIWTRPQDTGRVAPSFVNMHQVMDLFEEKFGPYPWHKIGYSGTSLGAMEHVGNISYPNFAINGTLTYESLWVHELSHMWFGNKATCHEAEEMWVNEGWGKYCENYYTEVIYDHETYINQMNSINKETLYKIHTNSGDGGYYALDNVPQDITYGMTSYEKGALIIHTLRNHLGDEAFFEASRHYLNTHSYDDATSEEMRDAFAESSGVNLDDFFDTWVFQPGRAGFVIESVVINESGTLEVYIKQKLKGRDYYGNNNVFEIGFYDENMNRETRVFTLSGEMGSLQYDDIPFEPVAVVIDPDHKMMDAATTRTHVFTDTELVSFGNEYIKVNVTGLPVDSIMVCGTHYWVAPDPIDPPVTGLTLSDYHYWHIDGVFPEDVEAQIFFYYNKNSYLDDNFITNSEDSLVLLYRRDATHPWGSIDFNQIGSWRSGNLVTDEIRKGDYTLALWDAAYVGHTEESMLHDGMIIYPNPSAERFTFEVHGEDIIIEVYDISGKCIFSSDTNMESVVWEAASFPAGTYTARMVRNGAVVATETLIKSK